MAIFVAYLLGKPSFLALSPQTIRASGQESAQHPIPTRFLPFHRRYSGLFSCPCIGQTPDLGTCFRAGFLGVIRASGQESGGDSCFQAGIHVLLGRNIRVSGQEHTGLWAGTYVLLGRNVVVTPYDVTIFLALTLLTAITLETTTLRGREPVAFPQ